MRRIRIASLGEDGRGYSESSTLSLPASGVLCSGSDDCRCSDMVASASRFSLSERVFSECVSLPKASAVLTPHGLSGSDFGENSSAVMVFSECEPLTVDIDENLEWFAECMDEANDERLLRLSENLCFGDIGVSICDSSDCVFCCCKDGGDRGRLVFSGNAYPPASQGVRFLPGIRVANICFCSASTAAPSFNIEVTSMASTSESLSR